MFAYGDLFMLVMIGYIFMFKMVKKMQNSVLEIVAGLTFHLTLTLPNHSVKVSSSFIVAALNGTTVLDSSPSGIN